MMADDVKEAEKSGYARGYKAGRKKTESELEKVDLYFKQETNRHRSEYVSIFCAALNSTLPLINWTIAGEQVLKQSDHILLAISIADEAVQKIRHKP